MTHHYRPLFIEVYCDICRFWRFWQRETESKFIYEARKVLDDWIVWIDGVALCHVCKEYEDHKPLPFAEQPD